jgi:predicted GH43/DUF377 family glycosyl hydrolase
MKEGAGYRMWLSGGDPRDLSRIVVQVYEAKSPDGIAWTINPTPVVKPSDDPKAFDSLRIETPSVIKVGDTYHMYYSGFDEKGAKEGVSSVGHATSKDGANWTRDPKNPVVVAQSTDKHKWGYRGAGEPGVVYNPADKTFYLYYVSMKFDGTNDSIGRIGLLLARSSDGTTFTEYTDASGERGLILTRDIPGAPAGAWFGYSTPCALITQDHKFHLFCAFIVAPVGPASARHVTLAHAESDDGVHYKIVEDEFFKAGKGDWKDLQVRAPSVIETDSQLKMWFAGETRIPYFAAGIGLATSQEKP